LPVSPKGDMELEDFFGGSQDRIDQVLQEEFEVAEIKTIPEINNLPFRNGFIVTSVLFVDIKESRLDLKEGHGRSTVAKIQKCFLNEMVHAAKYWNGKIQGFAGNMIMVLSDDDGRQANRALDIAITMQTIVKHILTPRLEKIYKEKFSCGVGIDFGKMLVAKVDTNHNNLVWAGGPAKVASKLADEADGGEIRVTDRIYDRLRDDLKKAGWWVKTGVKVMGKNETVYCNHGLYKTAVENILKKHVIVL